MPTPNSPEEWTGGARMTDRIWDEYIASVRPSDVGRISYDAYAAGFVRAVELAAKLLEEDGGYNSGLYAESIRTIPTKRAAPDLDDTKMEG